MAVILRVGLRGMFERRLDHNLGMIEEVGRRGLAGVNRRLIVNQDEAVGQEVSQVLESLETESEPGAVLPGREFLRTDRLKNGLDRDTQSLSCSRPGC